MGGFSLGCFEIENCRPHSIKNFWFNLFKTFINYVHLYQHMKIGFVSLMYVVTNAKDSAHSKFLSIKTPRKFRANKIDFIWKLQKAVEPKKQLVFLPMENINGPAVQIHSAWLKRTYPKRKNTSHQCHVLVRHLLNHVQKYSDRMIIGYAMVNVVKWLVMDPILEIQDSFSFPLYSHLSVSKLCPLIGLLPNIPRSDWLKI